MAVRPFHPARLASVVGLAAGALHYAGSHLPAPPMSPAALVGWLARTPPDLVLATTAGWLARLVLGWLALAVLATAIGTLPGRSGRAADLIAERMTPGALRRVVRVGLGASLTVSLTVLPGLARAGGGAPWPTVDRVPTGAAPPPSRPARPLGPEGPKRVFVVRPGDSLWGITARALGAGANPAAVAAAWPAWYAANRRTIGPDPNLIRPGQQLVPPPQPPSR